MLALFPSEIICGGKDEGGRKGDSRSIGNQWGLFIPAGSVCGGGGGVGVDCIICGCCAGFKDNRRDPSSSLFFNSI